MVGFLTACILGALLFCCGEPKRKDAAKKVQFFADPQLDELPEVSVFPAPADEEEALSDTPSDALKDVREARIGSGGDSGGAHSDSGGFGGFRAVGPSKLNAKDAEVQRAVSQVAEPQCTDEPLVFRHRPKSLRTPRPSMQSTFDVSVSWIQCLPKDGLVSPTSDEKLVLYGLFKQATIGDNRSAKPGMLTDFEARFKWDAWEGNKGKDAERAMKEYVEYIENVKAKYKA